MIDLSKLNEYLTPVTFQMDTLAKVKAVAEPGMFATSLDLSDAYHHIPMRADSQVYLCFQVKDKRYMYLVLPFGLMSAPWAFTEVVKQVKLWSSKRHLILFQYLDDWLNLFRSLLQAERWTDQLVELCHHLGLLVNLEKSELRPTQVIVFLGEKLDLQQGRAFPTRERQLTVMPLLTEATEQRGLPFPKAESLLGLLSATASTVPLGRLHMRPLQWDVIAQVRLGRDKGAWVPVIGQSAQALEWWRDQAHWLEGVPFQVPSHQEIVFTDASTKGWGVAFQGSMWSGTWLRPDRHINWLELRAVLVAVQLLQFRLKEKTVVFMIDNSTTVSYLKKQGGGGDEVASAPQVVIENTEVSPYDTTDHSPETHRGSVERLSGPGLKGGTGDSFGVGPLIVHVPVGDQPVPVGTTTGGHVRKQSKSQVKQIHIPVPGLTSVSSGCNKLPVAIGSNVCVSTDVHSGTISATSQDRGAIQDSPGSAVEPTGEVAAHSQQPTGEASDSISSGARNATPTTLESQSPESRVSEPTSGLPGEGRLKSLGFSDNVISRIGKSRATSTRKHYKSQWDLFVTWATEQKLNPLDASLPLLTSFMDYLFRVRNVSVRTILNYKSAIAFYWKSEVGYDVPENDTVVSDLIRSFKRDRPFPTKHVVEWDVHLVLNFFRSGRFKQWDLLSDRDLTLKTVFLLALATGKRRGELHALAKDVRWLSGAVRAVEISPVPEFLSKTHVKTNGLGALRPLTVSSLDGAVESEDNEERLLCPVRTLEAYLSRSDQYRSPEQKRLFISYRRGTVKDISRQTISVYIKEAVVLAYSDPSQKDTKSPVHVKPHSVRHVATSLSALRNFSLDDVLKAGAWSSPNVFLKHYVQNFSTDALSKLSRLGGFVAAGAVI